MNRCKPTDWTELLANECRVLEVDVMHGQIVSARISHPLLCRPRWFPRSKRGNFYSRDAGKRCEIDPHASGYIVRGELNGMASAPRHPREQAS